MRSIGLPGAIAAVLFLLAAPSGAGPGSEAIFGRWLTDDAKGIVTIFRCGKAACGRISEVLDRTPGLPATDVSNPNPALRKRSILSLPVLFGFRRNGVKWDGGRAYDPRSGISYRSRLALDTDGSLRVTGCVLFICQTKRWQRAPF